MNSSNIEHLLLFLGAAILYKRIPMWAFLGAAALLIELDQAMAWSPVWWQWFIRADTLLDLLADAVGIIGVHVFVKYQIITYGMFGINICHGKYRILKNECLNLFMASKYFYVKRFFGINWCKRLTSL